MYILDTDLFSLMDRSNSMESHRLRFRLAGIRNDDLATTIITFEEQSRGWLSWIRQSRTLEQEVSRYRELKKMIESYHKVKILDFDERAATHFAMLRKEHRRIGTMDLKIAAIAIANDATLLSRNLKDFGKVSGLNVEDWAA